VPSVARSINRRWNNTHRGQQAPNLQLLDPSSPTPAPPEAQPSARLRRVPQSLPAYARAGLPELGQGLVPARELGQGLDLCRPATLDFRSPFGKVNCGVLHGIALQDNLFSEADAQLLLPFELDLCLEIRRLWKTRKKTDSIRCVRQSRWRPNSGAV